MKLDKLKLENFKGIRHLSIAAGCSDLSIFGANASGKTTVADAISWLLFGKDTQGKADFEIKTIDHGTGEALHNLNHSVEATFVNGSPVTLRREYKEKYVKQRGQSEAEFTGHTTDFFIDGVPAKQKEYQEAVAKLSGGDEKIFRLLTSPTAFAVLPWQDQRSILIDNFGDVSDADVIATNSDLAELPDILGDRKAEDHKKVIQARRKEINKRLEEIPARIDEADKGKPEKLAITNPAKLTSQLEKLYAELSKQQEAVANIKAGGGAAKLRDRLAKQQQIIRDIAKQAEDKDRAAVAALKDDIAHQKDLMAGRNRDSQALAAELNRIAEDLVICQETREALIAEGRVEFAKVFDGDKCIACGQALPEDIRDLSLATFNQQRSLKLENNQKKGLANKQKMDVLTARQAEVHKMVASSNQAIADIKAKIADLEKQLAEVKPADLTTNPKYLEASAEAEALEKEIAKVEAGGTTSTEKEDAEIEAIKEQIAEANKAMSAIEQLQAAETRIAELKAEERKLAGEWQREEKELHLIDTFTRAKVSLLDERINAHFSLVRFKMSEEQINGGVKDICVMTVNGVPYNSLNNAARIQGGIDIIKALSKVYNFCPPIVIDNRESVTEIPEVEAQVINLVVSPEHRELTVVQ